MDGFTGQLTEAFAHVSTTDWLQAISIGTALLVFFYQQNKTVEAQKGSVRGSGGN